MVTINIRDIANEKFGGFRVKKDQIRINICPFCGCEGYKFLYDQKSSNFVCEKCEEVGKTDDPKAKFGVNEISIKSLKSMIFNKENMPGLVPADELSKRMCDYFEKFAPNETFDRENVIVTNNGKELAFIHLDGHKKLKAIKTIVDKGNTMGVEYKSDCLNSLWNADMVNDDKIILTLKEDNALMLIGKGIDNVVSISNDENVSFIEEYYDWFKDKKTIILAVPKTYADKYGKEISYRLGRDRVYLMEYEKDSLYTEHMGGNIEYFEKLTDGELKVEVKNIVTFKEIDDDENPYKDVLISSGDPSVDGILGGVRMGEMTIVSGTPGAGKTTVIEQLMCSFKNMNEPSMVYSGEFRVEMLKRRLMNVLAGVDNLDITPNIFNPNIIERRVKSKDVKDRIQDWVGDSIHVYEYDLIAQADDLLKTIEELYRRKGTRIFFLDNLMTIGFEGVNESNKWDVQKDFIVKLKHLTKKYPIHVFLIAHPKKLQDETEATMYDIHGTSDIPNLTDNILFLRRISDKEVEDLKKTNGGFKASVQMKLLKDRYHGRIGAKTYLDYDQRTGRLHSPHRNSNWHYGWEHGKYQGYATHMQEGL